MGDFRRTALKIGFLNKMDPGCGSGFNKKPKIFI
jgi:hypothetical protein